MLIILSVFSAAVSAQERIRTRGREQGMVLDLSKFTLGTMNNVEDKKQYLSTIQLEKQRIQNYTLGIVYENARDFYRKGDYQRAQDLAMAVLSVDPEFKNARTLAEQAQRMGTYGTISESEIIDAKMQEGERLYKLGRLVEANRKFEEILVFQPHNTQAAGWVARIDKDIAAEHERRGDAAYAEGKYDAALDQWYTALLMRKNDRGLTSKITRVEGEIRRTQLEAAMREGVENYSAGKLVASYESFQRALRIQPAEPKAQRFSAQIKGEIAQGYMDSGNKNFTAGKYDTAVKNWEEARKWGYNSAQNDAAIRKSLNAKAAAAERAKQEAARKQAAKQQANGKPAPPPEPIFKPEVFEQPVIEEDVFAVPLPGSGTERVSEENRQLSQAAYYRGTLAFNRDDYETARREWTLAKQLDPGNSDAEQGLRRVQEMLEVR